MPVERPVLAETISTARMKLGESTFDSAWASGRALTFDEAIDEALVFARSVTRLASPDHRQPHDQRGLSPRELEILRLIGEGYSNPEIATRLFISHKTVRNHVTNILAKLEVESRTAAAVYALRQGLL